MFTTRLSPRKPFFWSIIAGLVVASGLFNHHYFTQSYPLISLSISMDRDEALKKAHLLSEKHGWLPKNPRSAVEFTHDNLLHYFIELACGGKKAFTALLKSKEYEPYQWHVRQFQEKTTHETSLFFTPDGTPYGFAIKLPETEIRTNRATQEARELAQTIATAEWNISFKQYKEIEVSKDQKSCGRVDHTFVYERTNTSLGTEGKFRLKLVVSGDTVTEVTRFVFIPESFKRRFQEMRSSNTTVLTFGKLGLQFLYLFAGCLVAGFFFLRKRYLIIKPAFFGFLTFASALNELPHAWINYDTATSASSFLLNFIIKALAEGALTTAAMTALFSIILAWDHLAFPSRITFWKLWSPTVGSSLAIIGRTVGGYACFVIFLGISTATYFLLTQVFHWWCPADTLVDPNILATYIPWLTPFAQASSAGFFEEVLFRALPLAACVVIGRYYHCEKRALFLGFIIQALIFAACHAFYPQWPGYFRLFELLIPSWIFGVLYLYFGLLPGILSHFLYDLFFMSLPLFATTSLQAIISKSIIILLFLFPLLIVLYRRIQRGSWYILHEEDYNAASLPIEQITPETTDVNKELQKNSSFITANTFLPTTTKKILLGAGLLGFGLWIWCTPFTADTSSLNISKTTALACANKNFDYEKVPTPQGFVWEPYLFITNRPTDPEAFIWRTQGKEKYHDLLISYLTPPAWTIRYLSFSGETLDKAHEFISVIGSDETTLRNILILPESQEGALLSEEEARGLALQTIESQYDLSPKDLKEISATPQERPQRKDWVFIFKDKNITLLNDGEARLQITITGNKVTDSNRFIFVPEAWLRDQQQNNTHRELLTFFVLFVKALCCIMALGIVQKHLLASFSLQSTLIWMALIIPLVLIAELNALSQIMGAVLSSSQPYEAQVFTLIAGLLAGPLILATVLSVLIASLKNSIITKTLSNVAFFAVCAELFLQGIFEALCFISPHYTPFVPDYTNAATYSPFIGLFTSALLTLIQLGTVECLCIIAFTHVIRQSKHTWLYGILFFIISSIRYCSPFDFYPLTTLSIALILGLFFTLIYFLLLRYDQRAIIMMVATRISLSIIQEGIQGNYPHLLIYAIITIICIMLISYYWFTKLSPTKDSL